MNASPKKPTININALGVINALGNDNQQVLSSLQKGESRGMRAFATELLNRPFHCGVVDAELPEIPDSMARYDCRNNQLALAALLQIEQAISLSKAKYGTDRIGVVMGTSTSGIKEAEIALLAKQRTQKLPVSFDYKMQEIGALAEFVSLYLGLSGPSYSISTACSSSGKVFAAASRLLNCNICDAVIVGGADSLCDLTLGGFESLEAISGEPTNPFSVNREGINIGEGAAMFLLTRECLADDSLSERPDFCGLQLLGVGESSDAHHMSAPEPNGAGALASMRAALQAAALAPEQIDYLNLHGTGTKLNDSMEANAVNQLFGSQLSCSSTKPMTGHTLGAAGATEVAICCLILQQASFKIAPIHLFDGQPDPSLAKINLQQQTCFEKPITTAMSNSFAFGGNNVSVIVGIPGEIK